MEEREKFNIISYFLKMILASIVWMIVLSWILYCIPNFPQKLITIQFNPQEIFSFELSNLIAIVLAVVSQYLILVKGGVYPYSFKTDCKNPFFYLVLNILLGGFVCLVMSEFIQYEGIGSDYFAKAFVIIAVVNYFLYYARYGKEYNERELVEDWRNTVYGKTPSEEDKD